MAAEETYNGWKNYPTWAVNLWLSNEEHLYREALERTRETIADPPHTSEYWNAEETARYNVADMLKDWVRNEMDDTALGATMAADLFGWAVEQVDWNEIADAWIESAGDA